MEILEELAMKVGMSPKAVTRRLQRVGQLLRTCRALAGPRRKRGHTYQRKAASSK